MANGLSEQFMASVAEVSGIPIQQEGLYLGEDAAIIPMMAESGTIHVTASRREMVMNKGRLASLARARVETALRARARLD